MGPCPPSRPARRAPSARLRWWGPRSSSSAAPAHAAAADAPGTAGAPGTVGGTSALSGSPPPDVVAASAAPGSRWQPEAATYGAAADKDVAVTMSDGTVLRVNVVYPTDPKTGQEA